MSVIRWEDPPAASYGGPGKVKEVLSHELVAAQLKREPNRWAVIYVGAGSHGVASTVKAGRYAAFRPAGSFDAVTRTLDGVQHCYARYVGGES